jgi:hypothetical protein
MTKKQKRTITFIVIFSFVFCVMFSAIAYLLCDRNYYKEMYYKAIVELGSCEYKLKKYEGTSIDKLKFINFAIRCKDTQFYFILNKIYDISLFKNMDPYIILLLVSIESNFNPLAKSKTNDYGLMQINYSTWKKEYKIENDISLFDVTYNLNIGISIFYDFLKRCTFNFKVNNIENITKAILMYNSGDGNGKNFLYAEKMYVSPFFSQILNKN